MFLKFFFYIPILLNLWEVFKTNQKTEVIPHKEASTKDYWLYVRVCRYFGILYWGMMRKFVGVFFFMLKCRYLCDYYCGFVCNRSVVLELQYTGHKDGAQILALIIYLPTKMGRRFFFYLLHVSTRPSK